MTLATHCQQCVDCLPGCRRLPVQVPARAIAPHTMAMRAEGRRFPPRQAGAAPLFARAAAQTRRDAQPSHRRVGTSRPEPDPTPLPLLSPGLTPTQAQAQAQTHPPAPPWASTPPQPSPYSSRSRSPIVCRCTQGSLRRPCSSVGCGKGPKASFASHVSPAAAAAAAVAAAAAAAAAAAGWRRT